MLMWSIGAHILSLEVSIYTDGWVQYIYIDISFLSCRTWHGSNLYGERSVFSKESKYQDLYCGTSNVFDRQPPSAAWTGSSQVWSKGSRCVVVTFTPGTLHTAMSFHVLSCPFMSTVRWRQGFHLWTFPTPTWWIKPGSLGGMRKATAALRTSSPTSRRVASRTSTASPCPGSCCTITAPWGFCTLCPSTEGRVTPKCWSAPWPGGSLRKVFQSTVS